MASHVANVRCKECGKRCATKSGVCAGCAATKDKERFLEAYAEAGTLMGAARACRVSPAAVYRWLTKDAPFKESYQAAQRGQRAELIALLLKAARGELGTVMEVFRENGHAATREVPRDLSARQYKAIMTLLRATDHLADRYDALAFTEKRREELSAELADEREREEQAEQARKPRRLPPGSYLDYSDQPPPDAPWLGGNPPPPPLHIIHPVRREDFEEPAPEPPPKPASPPGPVRGPVGPPYAASCEPPKPQLKRW